MLVIAAVVVTLSLCRSCIPAKLLMVLFATIPVIWKPNYYKCVFVLYGGQRLATLDEYRPGGLISDN